MTAPVLSIPTRPWARATAIGLGTWAVAMATYLMANAVFWTVTRTAPPHPGDMLLVWNRWDTAHYVTIAGHGYSRVTENPAFFPLYPLLMAVFNPVLPGGLFSAAMIISSVACIAALTITYRLVDDLFDGATAARTTLYLMASPFAFFLVAAYNESLLIALCAGSLYCMRRGHWWWAGALGGLASGARQAGALLAVAFAIEYLRQRDWSVTKLRWDALAVALVPTGLIGFMIYCGIVLDDPLKFLHIQKFWGRTLHWPWDGTVLASGHLGYWWERGLFNPYAMLNLIDLATLAAVLALLVLSVVGPWRLGPQAWYLVAFAGLVLVMVLLSPLGRGLPPLHGLPRYALELLPAFIVLARAGRHTAVDRAYLMPAIALQTLLMVAFFGNLWLS